MASKLRKVFTVSHHLRYIYGFHLKHSRIRDDLILVESFHGKTIGDSGLVLAKEIKRLYGGRYHICFATVSPEEHKKALKDLGLDAEPVDISTARYVQVLATAKYIISNASLPAYFIRRPGQEYLQTWHGTPLKTLGRSMRYGIESMYNVQHNFLQASYILQPNEYTREVIMRDYFLDDLYTGKVIMAGYPRNQVLFDKDEADRLKKEWGLSGKTVYAYMPTWRGKSNHTIETDEYFSELGEILDVLDGSMSDDQVMFVNFHPIIRGSFSFSGYRHIRPFPENTDTYSFLSLSDALITDYSSVMFDYSITGKPVVLFMYDYEKYMRDRDMYLDVSELPFRKIYDTESFAECIQEDLCLSDTYDDPIYTEKFLGYESIDNPEKIIRLLIEKDSGSLKVIDYSSNKDRKWTLFAPARLDRESDFAELDDLCRDNKDLLVRLYKRWFADGTLNELLHDRYKELRYIVTVNKPPLTYADQLGKKLGSRAAAETIHKNDLMRCIPGITVEKEIHSTGVAARLTALSLSGGRIRLRAVIPGFSEDQVRYAALKYVSKVEDTVIPMKSRVTGTAEGAAVEAELVLSDDIPLKPVYWNVCIAVDSAEGVSFIRTGKAPDHIRRRIKYTDVSAECAGGYIIFPFFSKWGNLKFCYREKSEYDSRGTALREAAALAQYRIRGRDLRKQGNILIYEKFCHTAQDNGYYFFLYCMKNLPEEEKKRVFYVIDKRADDYSKLKEYDSHVIDFMSLKHMLYGMTAKALVSTDSVTHFYAWKCKPNPVYDRMRKVPELFLQHGVTAMKRVANLFGRNSSNPMTYFVATSQKEQDLIVREFGYDRENVPVTGFTRWDVLKDKRDKDDRYILIMPTWRSWLEDVSDEEFRKSEYYERYMDLITSEGFRRVLEKHELRAVLYIHPILAGYISSFSPSEQDRITCVPFGKQPLNELIMGAEMLITDYSSVCWDMLYIDKPVIFYQFDRERYLNVHGSYIDLEKDLPGDNVETAEEVISSLERCAEDGFRIRDEYAETAASFFMYRDDRNCERTYRFLKGKLGGKK
ncbi:MAG: CDP-glycerol glycerophosphotransferase family protein [Eubacterium sp.]|nr:CDP-glycerol glycerophosphotransferase family protein [Eubacterium sp.]